MLRGRGGSSWRRCVKRTRERRGVSRQDAAVCREAEGARLEAEAACREDKRRRRRVERTRCGGGATTGVT